MRITSIRDVLAGYAASSYRPLSGVAGGSAMRTAEYPSETDRDDTTDERSDDVSPPIG